MATVVCKHVSTVYPGMLIKPRVAIRLAFLENKTPHSWKTGYSRKARKVLLKAHCPVDVFCVTRQSAFIDNDNDNRLNPLHNPLILL